MTAAEALGLLRKIRALYGAQRDSLTASEPNLARASALNDEITAIAQRLPPPTQLESAAKDVMADLADEAAAVEDGRKAAVAALAKLRSRNEAEYQQLQRSTDVFRAYGAQKQTGPKFLDQRR
jgi:hypothetical protein